MKQSTPFRCSLRAKLFSPLVLTLTCVKSVFSLLVVCGSRKDHKNTTIKKELVLHLAVILPSSTLVIELEVEVVRWTCQVS